MGIGYAEICAFIIQFDDTDDLNYAENPVKQQVSSANLSEMACSSISEIDLAEKIVELTC